MKPILDACCGGKMFHTDKQNPAVMFMDIRREPPTKLSNRAIFSVEPDIVGDFTQIHFLDNTFSMVIFDPPHLRCGKKSFLFKKYGTLDKNWKETLRKGFNECFRVLRPQGTLIFKWSDGYKPLEDVLQLAPAQPIIVHSTPSQSGKKKTHFCVFMKLPQEETK